MAKLAVRKKLIAIGAASAIAATALTIIGMQTAHAAPACKINTDQTDSISNWRPVTTTQTFIVPEGGCKNIAVAVVDEFGEPVIDSSQQYSVRIREMDQASNWLTTHEGCFETVEADGKWTVVRRGIETPEHEDGDVEEINNSTDDCDRQEGCDDVRNTETHYAAPIQRAEDDREDEVATGTLFRVELRDQEWPNTGACDARTDVFLKVRY